VGRLSYSVRRGPFVLSLRRNALVVEVPIRVAASVCVPLGALCPSVGGCSPALRTIVEVPLALNERYELGPSRVTTDVERGCSIAGYDATGQIRSNAKSQSTQLKRQVDELLPSIGPEVTALWHGLQRPLPLEDGSCVVAEPKQVVQYPAALDAEHLVFRLGLFATLERHESCRGGDEDTPLRPPPAPDSSPASEQRGTVTVAHRMGWTAVSETLRRTVTEGAPPIREGQRIRSLRTEGIRVANGAGKPSAQRVAIRLDTEGSGCGPSWLIAEPGIDDDRPVVRLQNTSPLEATGKTASATFIAWVEKHASFAPKVGSAEVSDALRALVVKAMMRRSANAEVGPYSPTPLDQAVAVGERGLLVTRRSRGEIVLTIR